MTTTLHLFRPDTVHTDELGTYGQVFCGYLGGYATADPADTTCPECRRRSARLAMQAEQAEALTREELDAGAPVLELPGCGQSWCDCHQLGSRWCYACHVDWRAQHDCDEFRPHTPALCEHACRCDIGVNTRRASRAAANASEAQ